MTVLQDIVEDCLRVCHNVVNTHHKSPVPYKMAIAKTICIYILCYYCEYKPEKIYPLLNRRYTKSGFKYLVYKTEIKRVDLFKEAITQYKQNVRGYAKRVHETSLR